MAVKFIKVFKVALCFLPLVPALLLAIEFSMPKDVTEEELANVPEEKTEYGDSKRPSQIGEGLTVEKAPGKPAMAVTESDDAKELSEGDKTADTEDTEVAEADEDPGFMEFPLEEPGAEATAEGQGRISGQVFDKETGAPVRGVAIAVEGTDLGTITDANGDFRLNAVPEGTYTLAYFKTGYLAANITDVAVESGEVKRLDFALPPRPAEMSDDVYDLGTVMVTAEEANDLMMKLELRMNSDSMLNVLSADDFSRFAASDAAEALIRVPGVSIQDGRYAVIRGLAERYTAAEFNSLPLISPDPDRLSAQLDIFPSSILETVTVKKTFTPDMPGEATGGAIDVITLSMPEERIANFSFKVGGNSSVADAGDFPTDYQGKDDWLANGIEARDFPVDPSGQGFRVDFDRPQIDVGPFSDVGFKVNYGDTYEVFNDKKFGFAFGGYYDFSNRYIEEKNQRWEDDGEDEFGLILTDEFLLERGVQESTYAFLTSAGYDFSDNSKIRGNVFYIQKGESAANFAENSAFVAESLEYIQREMLSLQLFGEHILEFIESDFFGDIKFEWGGSLTNNVQEEIRSGYNADIEIQGGSEVFRIGVNHDTPPSAINRLTDQDSEALRLDLTLPVEDALGLELKIGLAYENAEREAEQVDKRYIFVDQFIRDLVEQGVFPPEFGFSQTFANEFISNLSQLADTVPEFGAGRVDAEGQREVTSHYFMGSLEPLDNLEIVGGLRVEKTYLNYGGEGNTLQVNLPLDFEDNPIDQTDILPSIAAKFDLSDDFSVRLAYSQTISRPSFRELSPFISLNYADSELEVGNPGIVWTPSGTLGPPPPALEMGEIYNYDLRFEYFNDNSDMFSISFFYKQVENAIERIIIRDLSVDLFGASSFPVFSWVNNDNKADVMGVELEARKNLDFISSWMSDFSVGGNFTYIDATVERSSFEVNQRISQNSSIEPILSEDRSLQGQPDILANIDVSYSNSDIGTDITLAFNYTGEQLYSIGDARTADRILIPYLRVDATWKQRISDYWSIKLSAENLTNPKRGIDFEQDQAGGKTRSFESFRSGISYSLSATCDF